MSLKRFRSVPLKYNIRSLWVRRAGTLMTALGIGLTVAVLVAMMALVNGLESTFTETGYETDLIVIRKGSQNETNSYFGRNVLQTIQFLPGVAKDAEDSPLAAGELMVVINQPRLNGEPSNIMVRGTTAASFKLRPEIRLVEGEMFRTGVRELIVSRSLSNRFQDMSLGDTLSIAGKDWKVAGIFDAGASAYNSEIWGDYEEVARDWNRPIFTSILLRAESAEVAQQLATRIDEDRQIQLQAIPQKEYFAAQQVSSIGIKALGLFVAVVMAIGSCFAAMNMMYGTILSRFREIGTLRSLGFSRVGILVSFVLESFVLAVLGGVIGCLLAFPVHGISSGTMNFATFSEVLFNFRITPGILVNALAFAGMVGIIGGFLPALHAARLRLVDVMRD